MSVPETPPKSSKRSRGRCPVCGFSFALRKDGNVQNHLLYGIGFGGRPVHCVGGERPPLAGGECAVWESPNAR